MLNEKIWRFGNVGLCDITDILYLKVNINSKLTLNNNKKGIT